MNYFKVLTANAICILLLLVIVNANAAIDNTIKDDSRIGIAASSTNTALNFATSGHIGMATSSN